jgi:hypothetical protein
VNAGAIINRFARGGTFVVTRRAAPTYVNGILVAGATSTFSIVARPRPSTGKDMERLPEGRRSQETRVFETTARLLTADQGGANNADLITTADGVFEIQHVEEWPVSVADTAFYTVIAQRPAA